MRSHGPAGHREAAAGFAPCRARAGLKVRHVNAVFAFQRHLHGFVFIFQAPEKETRGKHTSELSDISIRDTSPSWRHVFFFE